MTLGGWIVMILSVGGVTGLFLWCIYKVVTVPGATEHLRSEVNIEPPDVREE